MPDRYLIWIDGRLNLETEDKNEATTYALTLAESGREVIVEIYIDVGIPGYLMKYIYYDRDIGSLVYTDIDPRD